MRHVLALYSGTLCSGWAWKMSLERPGPQCLALTKASCCSYADPPGTWSWLPYSLVSLPCRAGMALTYMGMFALINRFSVIAFVALWFAQPLHANAVPPKVLIIGDSISKGYAPHVATLLDDKAEVVRIPENGETSAHGLERLDAWLGSTKWDVISFNFGLWDICYRNPDLPEGSDYDKVHGSISISLDQYKRNLERIVERLEKTKAHIVWENTTVVPDGEAGRKPEDVVKYNQAAKEIMERHGIPVIDLYDLTKRFEPRFFKRPQNVHYSDEGYQRIAIAVAQAIEDSLPVSGSHPR